MWFVFGFFIGTAAVENTAPADRQIKKWPYCNFAYVKAYLYNLETGLPVFNSPFDYRENRY